MLFCKPAGKSDILYEEVLKPGHTLQFRSLVLKKDLNILQHWSTRHHCRFWQPEGSFEKILTFYQNLLKNPDAHSFIGMLDEELICLIDIYRLATDALGRHIQHKPSDCRFHLVMAPCNEIIPGLSRQVMEIFLRYFFSFTDSRYLYAEPDIYHSKACRLLEKCGFSFLQNIMLSTKAASLYLMRKGQFLSR
jgi:hypothetical protein